MKISLLISTTLLASSINMTHASAEEFCADKEKWYGSSSAVHGKITQIMWLQKNQYLNRENLTSSDQKKISDGINDIASCIANELEKMTDTTPEILAHYKDRIDEVLRWAQIFNTSVSIQKEQMDVFFTPEVKIQWELKNLEKAIVQMEQYLKESREERLKRQYHMIWLHTYYLSQKTIHELWQLWFQKEAIDTKLNPVLLPFLKEYMGDMIYVMEQYLDSEEPLSLLPAYSIIEWKEIFNKMDEDFKVRKWVYDQDLLISLGKYHTMHSLIAETTEIHIRENINGKSISQ